MLTASLKHIMNELDLEKLPDKQGCAAVSMLFEKLRAPYMAGEDLAAYLKKNKWPLKLKKGTAMLTDLAQQMFTLSEQLPPFPLNGNKAHLLSAYLKAYGIEYHTLFPPPEIGEEDFQKYDIAYSPLILETPITSKLYSEKAGDKLENRIPGILVEAKKGDRKHIFSLAYSPSGLKWPIMDGEYIARFQQIEKKIPYRVRLINARQLNYFQSSQPYSYECDICLMENGKQIETTLSMNHVYETWSGYRFYLGGMTASESGLKRVQLIVNYDPAKYYLTYSGGVILALGIILLFWLRPYKG